MRISKRTLANITWVYLACGIVCALLYPFVSEAARGAIVILVMATLVPAAAVAHRSHGVGRRYIAAIAAVGVMYVGFGAIESYTEGPNQELWGSLFDAVANAVIIVLVAVSVRLRRGRFTRGDILDGIILAIGAWLVSWVVFVQPFLDASEVGTVHLVIDAMYLPMSMPLVALTAIFLFSGDLHRASNWLISAALLLNVGGDMIYGMEDTRHWGSWAFVGADAMYVLAFTCAGAALLHPSAPELFSRSESHRPASLPRRMILTALALVIPMMVVLVVPASSTADRMLRATFALVLLLLVGGRLVEATRSTLRTHDRMVQMARTDHLTDLPNKMAVLDHADELIADVWRSDTSPSLYLFDLDRFKNLNDSLGHAAGDEVLRIVADRLTLAASSFGATVGRPSGDEFIVLDPTPSSSAQALAHAEAIHSVFKQPLSLRSDAIFVTASVGVAAMPAGRPLTGEELFRQADIAMYRAKASGRNCLALYHDSMQERVSHRMRVETELHGAIDRREIRLFHQPIVDIETGRVSGFEALIRWQRNDGTMVPPVEFIPIAEETGLIHTIGSWALLEALSQLRTWIDDGVVPPHATMSVNVSPKQLTDPNFGRTVDEALQRSRLPAHHLWVEVTESVMVENPQQSQRTLQSVRELGVRIALDDFGTGYSSLSLLQKFPIQRIKIDREFIDGIADNQNDRSLVETIIGMGDSMGLDIVAEGVETVDQLRLLRTLQCAKAQGFLISHPVPAEAMPSTINALESLAQWPEFGRLLGDSTLEPRQRRA